MYKKGLQSLDVDVNALGSNLKVEYFNFIDLTSFQTQCAAVQSQNKGV